MRRGGEGRARGVAGRLVLARDGAALEKIEVVERLVRVEHQSWSDESSWLGEGHAEPDERVTKSQGPSGWE